MPKLRRVRLVSIGHESARFEDVVLDFTDRSGRPTNSVLWLRNGGGKTSLLSLLFASVRPSQREFLGKRADEKVRALEHYVGPRDSGVVVCEWELDAENSLFGDLAPRYLSGVFYERAVAHEGNGAAKVKPLYFATMVSPEVAALSLDGLPLTTADGTHRHRRNMNGFRRVLRELDAAYPHLSVFVSDKQHQYTDELASRGIDSEVFYYQVLMNEREGGVSERFSFAQDDEFIDFLLLMAFSRDRAQEVLDQLSTFRQALVTRNEQLKPEHEYCSGLQSRLQHLVGVQRDRQLVYAHTRTSHQQLLALTSSLATLEERLTASITRLEASIAEAESEVARCRERQEKESRIAAVFDREACRLRFVSINAEYEQAEREHTAAKRLKEIWSAGRFLARAHEARRLAKDLREQLARQQTQFAPDLERLTLAAARFCAALKFADSTLATGETTASKEVTELSQRNADMQELAQQAGESAARHESKAEHIRQRLAVASAEFTRLRTIGVVLPDEPSSAAAIHRYESELASIAVAIAEQGRLIEAERPRIEAAKERLPNEETVLKENRRQLDSLSDELRRGEQRRSQLEQDSTLLRLLQTDHVDVEAALARSIDAAGNEARRVRDLILRIQVEAVEERRAIAWLQGDGELLPPSVDVHSVLEWLSSAGVTAWSGWEYLSHQKRAEQRRLIERFPYIAAGVVVANKDYDSVADLASSSTPPHLGTAIVLCPADALQQSAELTWTVVGPSSDAHFDRDAAAKELLRLTAAESARSKELNEHEQWQHDLTALQERLRAFQAEYPPGWFARQRQRIEVAEAHYQDSLAVVEQTHAEISRSEAALSQAKDLREQFRTSQIANQGQLERVRDYERQHGVHVENWTQELASAERDARNCRAEQRRHTEQAEEFAVQAEAARRRLGQLLNERTQVRQELNQLKYTEQAEVVENAGQLDSLRADYQLLVDEYERKVNEDGLNQMAEAKDRDAEKEERDYRRVLTGSPDIGETDVEEELARLPAGASAEVRAEETDKAAGEASRGLGTLANRRRPIKERFEEANKRSEELRKTGDLPVVELSADADQNDAAAEKHRASAKEQEQFVTEFEAEIRRLQDQVNEARLDTTKLAKDRERLASIETNYEAEFQRVPPEELSASPPMPNAATVIADVDQLGTHVSALESALRSQRQAHASLDQRRDKSADEIGAWSRQERFVKLTNSVASRFAGMRGIVLESKADLFSKELDDRITEIERDLEEANQHHERVVNIVLAAVDEALNLLNRVSRMSKVPDSLPQAGKQFLVIETNASENPAERRIKVGDLIDELLETGNVGDGLNLLQKAVRRVAVRTKVRILHPDLQHATKRMSIAAMRQLSGGERLTCAVLLFCALVRLRHREGSRRGSSVLILDNPIGTASRVSFLDLQREVARSMNVQLIYATGVKDLNAVGALENVIRLRNSRVDRRSGRRVVEVEEPESPSGEVRAARVVFDSPPSSPVNARIAESEVTTHPESEASNDAAGPR